MASKVKFDPKNKDLLLSPERRQSLDTHRLLSTVPIMAHHWVADIGCGPGYFTVPLGKYLFDGKVFALDVQQDMLDATQQTLDTVHLTNVEVAKSKESKLPARRRCLGRSSDGVRVTRSQVPESVAQGCREMSEKVGLASYPRMAQTGDRWRSAHRSTHRRRRDERSGGGSRSEAPVDPRPQRGPVHGNGCKVDDVNERTHQ